MLGSPFGVLLLGGCIASVQNRFGEYAQLRATGEPGSFMQSFNHLHTLLAMVEAGAQMLLFEMIPAALAREITAWSPVPVIGIGAGPGTNGQIQVIYDILDITPGRKPKFVHNFMAGHDSPLAGLKSYVAAVKDRSYPQPEHCF